MGTPPDEWEDFFAFYLRDIRPHAPYFSLSSDRRDDELGVVEMLNESRKKQGEEGFRSIRSRREGDDPPDCEAKGPNGERIGIEVTEFVDGDSIPAAKNGTATPCEPWDPAYVIDQMRCRVRRKDRSNIKDGPYEKYVLILFCDEPRALDYPIIERIRKEQFGPTTLIQDAYFLMSYCPWVKCCPFIELDLRQR